MSARRAVITVPNTATPSALPSVRKKLTADVAAPMSAAGAVFWTAIVMIGIEEPIPMPMMPMPREMNRRVVVTSIVDSSTRPTSAIPMPMIG